MFLFSANVNILRSTFAGVMADEFFLIPTTEARGCLRAVQETIQHFSQVKEIH